MFRQLNEMSKCIGQILVSRENDEAVRLALMETTIDMSMIPFDVEGFQQSVFKALNGSSTASFTLGGNMEQNYAEKPGYLNQDLSLPKGQYDLVRAVSNATKACGGKVILVYIALRTSRDRLDSLVSLSVTVYR